MSDAASIAAFDWPTAIQRLARRIAPRASPRSPARFSIVITHASTHAATALASSRFARVASARCIVSAA